MHILYHELLSMCHERSILPVVAVRAAIEVAAIETTPEDFKRQMRDKTLSLVMPEIPQGMEYAKDCFWRFFQQKFIWHRAWCGTSKQKDVAAEFIRKHREIAQNRGSQWPPKPTFRPKVTLPQPRDGKGGANGWVPRSGKE